ncbi:hypothetical protein [Eubacterium sp.]|uniref:hypothetical protein n=1 Tax=Eubacterium sp. TaxID=142586 RepID=UPI0025BD8577|nr:hypothetical protein [Eubacterium sp.]MCI7800332.1 hypothetical protein [Eubacterium sp.]
MKKMFKKSIAMLIAVLMVISAMPFTAITAFAADSAEKSYVKANIASFNGFTGTSNYTYNGTDLSAGYSDYYSNIVYDDGEFLDGDVTINNEVRVKAFINSNVVLLYDGKNDTILPVVGDALKTTNNVGTGQKYFKQIRVRTDTTGNFWELKEDWKGNSGTWNAWPTSSDMTVSYNNANSEFYMNKYSEYLFRNKLYYKGSSNTSTYYDAFTPSSNKIEFTSVHAQWGIGEGNRDTNFGDSNSNVYVINYKPILDKIDLMKQVYNSIQSNGEDKYCTDYLENFYKAAYKVMTLNPNNYPYSSGVESAVQSAAGAIKDVVDNYLTTATTEPTKHTLVDIPGKDATCGETGLTVGKKCSRCGTVTVAQTEIPATGNHTYGKAEYVNETQHKYVCSVCGNVKTEDHNFVDGKCTKCDYVPLDLSTYNAAITEADGIIANSDGKYTADSVNAYKTAVDTAKAKTYSTQKEIDAIISEIQSAQTLLQKARVTITFVVEKEDGTYTTDTKNPDWGESVNLDTQSNYVSKWTIDVNGVTSKIDSNATAIDHVATENATIKAYVTDEKPDTKYSKVTFLGKNSAVVGIKYVAADTTVDTNTLLTVPAIPFYENGKWDKAEITADGSDITVRATYVPKAGDENKCGIHFKGDTKYYNYDSYVYLFNADKSKKYAMYADAEAQELITYLGGVDFSVPRRDDIYIKEVNADEMKAAIGFSGSYQQGLKSSFNVKFWLPEDATLIETGVDLVAKFPDGTVKRAHDRATKFNARNEYTYTASFGDSKKTVEFKPYLTYKKDGVKTTVYGTSQTVEFN